MILEVMILKILVLEMLILLKVYVSEFAFISGIYSMHTSIRAVYINNICAKNACVNDRNLKF